MESEDKFERLAKHHSLSPATVQAVFAALHRGGGRMAQFSHADFGRDVAMAAGHVDGWRHVQYPTQI